MDSRDTTRVTRTEMTINQNTESKGAAFHS